MVTSVEVCKSPPLDGVIPIRYTKYTDNPQSNVQIVEISIDFSELWGGGGSSHTFDTSFYHENEEISTVEAPRLTETPHSYYVLSCVPPQLATFTNASTHTHTRRQWCVREIRTLTETKRIPYFLFECK